MNPINTKRLVLFDIDGTLVSTNGVAKRCFTEALDSVLGISLHGSDHDFAGKLDTQLFREIVSKAGIDPETVLHRFDEFVERFYTDLAPQLTTETVHVHPGVQDLLETLSVKNDVLPALLTGNLERGAQLKLETHNLYKYFHFGVYGSDGTARVELPAVAVERAFALTGRRFQEKEIVVIGDTPNDILCARPLNARSIAVATGGASYETLLSYRPDFVFRSLADIPAVVDAIMH